ncbi:MAG: hypothetical protein HY699_00425 [Deltaproteobacteria bacterium]|nr:hypothetical protein [Deltaproteobacteria bacterium]
MKRAVLGFLITVLVTPQAAQASGFMYRAASTGRWLGLAVQGDTRATGTFSGRVFQSFPGTVKAPLAYAAGGGACGVNPLSVAAFSAELSGSAPNTGIFLYDGGTDTIYDGILEGATTPAGGTFAPLDGRNPAIVIETGPATCKVHVFFVSKITGLGTDTGIFHAVFDPAASYGLLSLTAIAVEGATAAPAPFPGSATFGDFPATAKVSARGYPISGGAFIPHIAFRAKITGGGIVNSNDTAIMVWSSVLGFYVVAREGDPSCAPNWAFGGSVYDKFSASMEIAAGGGYLPEVPSAMYRAKGRGGPSTSDTAIELGIADGCGAPHPVPWGIEGSATPIGGTYADFAPSTPFDAASGDPYPAFHMAFQGKITGGPTTKALFLIGNSYWDVMRQGFTDTALSSGKLTLAANLGPALNAGGTLIYRGSVAGLTSGLFAFKDTTISPSQLVTFAGSMAQIDTAGNMTARFP